jgi:unsaturated chondroitin disaccharide hydrolase
MSNAEYYIGHTPDDGITPWDYDAPNAGSLSRRQVDTSAAAIAASGLLDLAGAAPTAALARCYRDFAINSLTSLCDRYLGDKSPGFEGILNGGVYHIHKGLGVHEAVLFGDYYFVEALDKALKILDRRPTEATISYPEDSLPESARQWRDGPTEEELSSPTGENKE